MAQYLLLGSVIHLVTLICSQLSHVSAEDMKVAAHIVNCSAVKSISSVSNCSFRLETEVLDLSFNKIERIHSQDFTGLTQLKELYLQFNQIRVIDDDAFRDLIQLELLSISNNMLLDVSALPLNTGLSLKYLDLTYNSYEEIHLGVQFGGLKQLETLNLGNRQIASLNRNDFQAVSELPLKNVFLITGDLQSYESSTLKVLKNLETLTLESNTWKNVQLLTLLIEDVSNASKALKISNTNFTEGENVSSVFSQLTNSQLTSLVLQNIIINDVSVASLFSAVLHSDIEELIVDSPRFDGIGSWNTQISPFYQTKLQKLVLENIDNPNFYKFYSLDYMADVFRQLTEISLIRANLFYLSCEISETMVNLVYANLANNVLVEYSLFPWCNNPFPSLQTLNLNNNKFTDLQKLSELTSHMKNLSFISADFNAIRLTPGSVCAWTESLKDLVLRNNNLSSNVFDCLPGSIENLDFSFNNITLLYNLEKLKFLKELYLTGNQISSFPLPQMVPSLKVLYIDHNKISDINVDQFKSFSLIELLSGNNPFTCDCEINALSNLLDSSPTAVLDWPNDYICQLPQVMKGKQLNSLYFSPIQCNPGLVIGIIVACVLLAVIVSVFLFIKFNGPWYVHTLCLWIKAKRSDDIDLAEKNLEYHAFISYSEYDSLWVKDNLMLQLENNDPPYRVCIHERDFKPGKPITTNIIDCISKSYKTIFVLSQKFVQSEWCHYEFFFAHHQLFDEKKDSLILLLLEPIPANSIPDRFCKLRKLMNRNTYLEWPQDKTRQSVFWKRLKAVLDIDFKANCIPEHDPESD